MVSPGRVEVGFQKAKKSLKVAQGGGLETISASSGPPWSQPHLHPLLAGPSWQVPQSQPQPIRASHSSALAWAAQESTYSLGRGDRVEGGRPGWGAGSFISSASQLSL